jgi:predicted alpha/beta-hydrolase family hydrolase
VSPFLIIQGDHDSFGLKAEVVNQKLPSNVSIIWIYNGEHSLMPLQHKMVNMTKYDNWHIAS